MVAQIGDDGLARELADDLRAAQHRTAHRLVGKRALLEIIEDDVVGRVVCLADLLQDHRALALELGRVEARIHQDVGEDVERERHILLQHLGVIGRALARGIGVEVAADRLDLLGDGAGAAPLGALERHVLEEMGGAVDLRHLVPGADIDPEAERGRVHRIDPVGDDPEPVRERCELRRHAAPRFGCVRRAWARTKRATAPTSLGKMVIRSRFSMISASADGTGRADAGGALDRIGKFCRMGGGERDHRGRSVLLLHLRPGGGDRDRGMRIDQHARAAVGVGHRRERRRIVDPMPGEEAARAPPGLLVGRQRALLPERLQRGGDRGAVMVLQLEQQPLEIARHLDVHARAEARDDRRDRHRRRWPDTAPGCRSHWCR